MLELDQFYDYSTSYPKSSEKDGEKEEGDDGEVPVQVRYFQIAAMFENIFQAALDQGWQLQLPSGATVGHRSLQRYYRQYLRPVLSGGQSANHAHVNRGVVDKLMLEYSRGHGGGIAAATGGRSSNALSLGISSMFKLKVKKPNSGFRLPIGYFFLRHFLFI
jgi:pre-60S factor REI1